MIKKFQSLNYNDKPICQSIALTLLDYGVKDIKIENGFHCGKKYRANTQIWFSSITCYPGVYVEYQNSLIEDKTTCLFWAILKSLNIRYSGGASDIHMQASFLTDALKEASYKVNNLTAKEFFSEIYCYFHEMKRLEE